jgi:hypothetical protein
MSIRSITKGLVKRLYEFDATIPKHDPGTKADYEANEKFILYNILPTVSAVTAFGNGATTLERGVLKVWILYPFGEGSGKLLSKTEELRNHFFPKDGKGLAITQDGILIRIEEPVSITQIYGPDDLTQAHNYIICNIKYYAHIFPEC